jgi:preprotein translocase subunit SecF
MKLISSDTRVDFIGKRTVAALFSVAMLLVSAGSLIAHGGPNYGIDFEGGTLIQLKFAGEADTVAVRKTLADMGLSDYSVQQFGAPEEILINIERADEEGGPSASEAVVEALQERFGDEAFIVDRVEMVGPKVGDDLRGKALAAMLYAMVGILIYITLRFELRFGLAAVAALLHDTVIVIGAFSLADKEFTLPVIAALLTVIGYSLNDTIVVFDRIRDNLKLRRGMPLGELLNMSINQTLSRTILTSGTTMLVIAAIFVLGGAVIHDFAFALLVGVGVGTYSSIYVASPILMLFDKKKPSSPAAAPAAQ